MSAGQYEDNEDKDVMGYELSRRVGGEKRSVRVSPANRDTTPPSGRAPSLEGPRRDEVDFLTPLAFYSLHRFGTLKTLTAPVHLRIYVSDLVFELLHLFQLAVQFFLQLAVSMHFSAEAVVSEASQCVVDPVFAPIVVVENAHALGRRRGRLFRCKYGVPRRLVVDILGLLGRSCPEHRGHLSCGW
jgi:hypothetical protein